MKGDKSTSTDYQKDNRVDDNERNFVCPICHSNLRFSEENVVCQENNHQFNWRNGKIDFTVCVPIPGPKITLLGPKACLLSSFVQYVQNKKVLEVGAKQPFYKHLSFAMDVLQDYTCFDIVPHEGLDFIGQAEFLPFQNDGFDAVILHTVLEHVFDPFKTGSEIYRVLRPGGLAWVSVPFLYVKHGTPDRWRFTYEGLQYVFRDFRKMLLQPTGGYIATTLRFLTLFRYLQVTALRIGNWLERKIIGAIKPDHSSFFNLILIK